MKIYLIGSLRNEQIIQIGNRLREAGYATFDDWWAPGRDTDSYWQAYCKARGQTYRDALQGPYAKHVFAFDKHHLDNSQIGVLIMPAGKSAHLELGYMRGGGKPCYIVMDGEPERYDIMTQLATAVVFSVEELLMELSKLK